MKRPQKIKDSAMLTIWWSLIALPVLIAAWVQFIISHLLWRARAKASVDQSRHRRRTSSGTLSVVR